MEYASNIMWTQNFKGYLYSMPYKERNDGK